MKTLLLALLLSFDVSPTPGAYTDCWAWQRGMEQRWLPGDGAPVWGEAMGFPEAVSCEVLHDPLTGEGWAEAGCTQPLCAFCVYSQFVICPPGLTCVPSKCAEVTGYVEDLR